MKLITFKSMDALKSLINNGLSLKSYKRLSIVIFLNSIVSPPLPFYLATKFVWYSKVKIKCLATGFHLPVNIVSLAPGPEITPWFFAVRKGLFRHSIPVINMCICLQNASRNVAQIYLIFQPKILSCNFLAGFYRLFLLHMYLLFFQITVSSKKYHRN